ncbi:MAG: signal peptidase I [Propionibacteriaceae bacterium]|jgi:signal peptidase|nr:signal peptidase I [Propionibacteriaceae bacterium]
MGAKTTAAEPASAATRPTKFEMIVRRILSLALTLAVMALLIAALALVAIPKLLGGMSLTIVSGSMEPGIDPGDVVVTWGVDESNWNDFAIGQVITFLPFPDDPALVTHRIVGKIISSNGAVFYETRGDANEDLDPWGPVEASHVRGAFAYVVPKMGWFRQWAGGENTPAIVLAAAAGLIVYGLALFALGLRRAPTPEAAADESAETAAAGPAADGEDQSEGVAAGSAAAAGSCSEGAAENGSEGGGESGEVVGAGSEGAAQGGSARTAAGGIG